MGGSVPQLSTFLHFPAEVTHPQEAVVLRISVVQIEINLVCFTFIFVPFPKSFNFFPITIIVRLPINHRSSSADTKLQKNCKPRSTITVIITATSYGHIIQAGRLLPVISCLCKMAKGLNCNHPSPSQFPAPSSRACSTGCYLHLHYCKQLHCIDHVCAVWQAACCHL